MSDSSQWWSASPGRERPRLRIEEDEIVSGGGELAVHFFTIVLNGQPFIRHHIEQLRNLPFPWHWHIVEGAAALRHDTAWSVAHGGNLSETFHRQGLSIDGTSEYLDELARDFPQQVTIYRKPGGELWDGKVEMANRPLASIREECLLWQIDADELWTAQQFEDGRQLFRDNPTKTAAVYWCWFFVGPDRVVSTRQCYSNNPAIEWLRTWRYRPGMRFAAHEPPVLIEPLPDGTWRGVESVNPLLHAQTEAGGLVFQHYAYATAQQLRFKEEYYGYRGALRRWQALQARQDLPVPLRQYFPWVLDEAQVDFSRHYVEKPLIEIPPADLSIYATPTEAPRPRVVIDGIFFQLYQTGITRVWRELLKQWVADGFAEHLLVVDRAGTMPQIPGVGYVAAPPHDYGDLEHDRQMLQKICDEFGADVFISSYYSRPQRTPAVMMVHDMIPELQGYNLQEPMWREKHELIAAARHFVCVSQATARDLARFFPNIPQEKITVTPLAAAEVFHPRPPEQIEALRAATGITRPFFLIVGARGGYKNTELTFRALSRLPDPSRFEILCAGHTTLEPEYQRQVPQMTVKSFHLNDDLLAAAYSGAAALLHPSRYEGFGLPVIEAMACGCPVITTRNGALAEVAGDAALLVRHDDAGGLLAAMAEVIRPPVRQRLVDAGLAHAVKFSWRDTAARIRAVLVGQSA